MRYYKYHIYFSIFVLSIQIGLSQAFKTGDKVEAFINNAWKEARIVKVPAGKSILFEVEETTKNDHAQKKNSLKLSKQNIRIVKEQLVSSTKTITASEKKLQLGKYDLYSGIPTMYIGHIILAGDGVYKVAFGTDESNYEIGKYSFDETANNIIWLTGLFKNKGWGGKVTAKSATVSRIEFNNVTYAENN